MFRTFALAAVAMALPFAAPASAQKHSAARSDVLLGGADIPDQTIQYLAYPSKAGDRPITAAGRLQMPRQRSGRIPAVIIMHGTSGVSQRGIYYGNALNRAGIATFEVDQWGARGLSGSADDRPQTVHETLEDVYGAIDLLAARPEIDPNRIAIMGFSWGGVVSMLAATKSIEAAHAKAGRPHIVAAMPIYPVCWVYNRVPGYEWRDLMPIPVRIIAAGADDYDEGAQPCTDLVGSLAEPVRRNVSLVIYPNAPHAFDGFVPVYRHPDPYGHRGRGGEVTIGVDANARTQAREEVVRFFTAALKP